MSSAPGNRLALRFVLFAVWTLPACDSRESESPPSDMPPNVLIVLADTLRADHLGCYGYDQPTSPNLDRFAKTGVLFERACSTAPWTPPSVASLFTGLLPEVHHVLQYRGLYGSPGDDLQGDRLSGHAYPMAEYFSAAGYQTMAIMSNPWLTAREGFSQGFDHFDDSRCRQETLATAADINRAAFRLLENRDRDRPFFMYLHYMDVHAPYNAPDQFRKPFVDKAKAAPRTPPIQDTPAAGRGGLANIANGTARPDRDMVDQAAYWTALYDAGIADFDHQFGLFHRKLEERGLLSSTVVVFVSDHGEELNDHGGWDHGFNLHEHQLRVPLIFSSPELFSGDRRVGHVVSLVDIIVTLHELCGMPEPVGHQGFSLVPLLEGGSEGPRKYAFAEAVKHARSTKAVYSSQHKLIYRTDSEWAAIYDLRNDPQERAALPPNPVSKKIFLELKAEGDRQVQENIKHGKLFEPESVPMSSETRERLKSLGYID